VRSDPEWTHRPLYNRAHEPGRACCVSATQTTAPLVVSKPVRVLQLADFAGPYAGSFVDALQALSDAARARGWSTELVLPDRARARDWTSVLRFERIRYMATHSRLGMARGIWQIVRESDAPTVIHSHFTTFDVPAVLASVNRSRTIIFWHMHGHNRDAPLVKMRGRIKDSVFGRRVSGILCVAPDVADAVRLGGAPRERVAFVPNAINTDRFPLVSKERARDARSSLPLEPGTAVLMHFGWDWERKGGDLFLAATKILLDRGRKVKAVAVRGGGEARALGEALALGNSLVIHEPSENAEDLYAMADVFISPSRAEGMPFSIAEALCSGLPTVATRIAGQAVLYGNVSACRLTDFSPDDVADAICSILDRDPQVALAEAVEARKWICRHMDIKPWAEAIVRSYDRALRGDRLLDGDRLVPTP
jgi:glycosyltransferase involved in cell wall biosynthesis